MKQNKPYISKSDEETWKRFIDEMEKSNQLKPPSDIYSDIATRKLDLHGYTLHTAWQAFREFVESHAKSGTKSVVVITGRSGQIVHEFKEWCRLSNHVSCYQPIVTKGGTAGSFRVMLNVKGIRRKRAV